MEGLDDIIMFNSFMFFSNLIIVEVSAVLSFFTSVVAAYGDIELEFLSTIAVFVYVGAVAMLLLFTIMLIDISENEDNAVDVDLAIGLFLLIFTSIFSDARYTDALSLLTFSDFSETYLDSFTGMLNTSELLLLADLYEFTIAFVLLGCVLVTSLMGIVVVVLQVSHNSVWAGFFNKTYALNAQYQLLLLKSQSYN